MNFTRHTARIGIVSLVAALVWSCDVAEEVRQTDQQYSLDTILQRNLELERGAGDTRAIRTVEAIARISEADYTLIGRYRAASDGVMRIDVFADGKRVYSEGIDELGTWEWPGGEAAPFEVTHDGAGALQHGIEFNLFSLAELESRGHTVELVGREEIRGNRYFVLKVTLNDGFETYRYINEESWQVDLSRDYRALHPGVDPEKASIETRRDQWLRTEGILHATRSRDFVGSSDQPTQTVEVLRAMYNVPKSELDIDRSYVPDGAPDFR